MDVRAHRMLLALAVAILVAAPGIRAADDIVVYDDALGDGFDDWSWAVHDLAATAHVHSGAVSASFEPDGWSALYFQHQGGFDAAAVESCRFWLHGGGVGGQQLRFHLWSGGASVAAIDLAPYLPPGGIPAAAWVEVTIPLAALGLTGGTFDALLWQDATGTDQPAAYLDDVVLVGADPPPPAPVTVSVDPAADRRPIDPRIYGVNFGPHGPDVPPYTVRRWGGNSTTRYNWRADVHHTGADWFFLNVPGSHPDPAQLPDGSQADLFVADARAAGAEPILTVPTIGWTPREERVKQWAFSVSGYGPQGATECDAQPWACEPDAGDGTCNPAVNTTGYCVDGLIRGNDPADTSLPAGPGFVTDWIAHLHGTFGTASGDGVRLYALDNEPMLWHHTHRDVHPGHATFDEVWSRGLDVARAVKDADPAAEVLGPVVWGWCAFFASAADAQSGSCVDGPDRQAHGGLPFLEWYAGQVCLEQSATGVRPVDSLDVHFYPQGAGVAGFGGDGEDPVTAARRLRSVRELYDPAWVSESWIGEPVELIPRLRRWIDRACPGLGLAVTEYRWGSDDGPSSALAHAEVLAIFGREGVDLATRWVAPGEGTRVEDAFRLFLDYDGAGSRVEGHSVRATSSDDPAVGAYAVDAPDDRLLLLLFNRDTVGREAEVAIAAPLDGDGVAYRFDAATPLGPAGVVPSSDGALSLTLPARSATLVELHTASDGLFADGFESGDTAAWSVAEP